MFSSHSLCDVIYDKRVAIGKLLIICSESKSLFIIEFLFWSIVFTMAFWNMTHPSVEFKKGLINLSISPIRNVYRYLLIWEMIGRLICTHKYISSFLRRKILLEILHKSVQKSLFRYITQIYVCKINICLMHILRYWIFWRNKVPKKGYYYSGH